MKFLDSKKLVDQNTILEVERRLGIELPQKYRGFLLENNGGYPELPVFQMAETGELGVIQQLFCIAPESPDDIVRANERYHGRLPKSVLPIGYDPGGNLLVIGVSGLMEGRVLFWDHEAEGSRAGTDGLGNLVLIADSWDDFLAGLKADD